MELSYAGFWKRLAAAIIDGLILGIPIVGIMVVIGLVVAISMGGSEQSFALADSLCQLVQLVGIVIHWLYAAIMESSEKQATIGKMCLGLKVTDVLGERISFARASGRFWAKIVSNLTCLIGYVMAGFTERKQALHDNIARTLVLNKA